jgi:hypothetical protein
MFLRRSKALLMIFMANSCRVVFLRAKNTCLLICSEVFYTFVHNKPESSAADWLKNFEIGV